MCKVDLKLFILISSVLMQLHAADVVKDLGAAVKIAKAAEPVVKAAVPLIEDGAKAVGEGVKQVKDHHHKSGKKPTLEDLAATVAAQGKALEELRAIMEKSSEQHEAFVKKQVASVKVPTSKNPRGFVLSNPNDPLVTESKLKVVTAPLQTDIQGLQASMGSHVTQQQLTDATQDVVRQHDLRGYITKDEIANKINNGVKYAAGQSALGFSSYRLSSMIASLLQSAGMENQYLDLRDISVPMTTCMTSFFARAIKQIYQTQKVSNLQTVAQKSLQDAVSSGVVIALKNIIFDEQMDAYWNACSENRKAGYYAAAVVPVSLLVDLCAHH